MGINEIIMYIMMFFMLIAAVDRILSQFGGSARFLGKFGKSIEGSGGQFEEGFMAMGALGLAMVGMTALAPVLAHVLGPVIIPVYEMLGANPSMFAGTLLACDMGGFFLAKELAGGDVAAWLYSGLILGSMMGPTIVFSIPVALADDMLATRPESMQVYVEQIKLAGEIHLKARNALLEGAAPQRYQWFLQTYPGVADQVSGKIIASFLGITPVTLSRLRRSMRQEAGGGRNDPT